MLLHFQETREKVALLLQLSDNLIEKGHTHTDNIKSWASLVDRRYNEFSIRMEKHRDKLMSTLGIPLDGSGVSDIIRVVCSIRFKNRPPGCCYVFVCF